MAHSIARQLAPSGKPGPFCIASKHLQTRRQARLVIHSVLEVPRRRGRKFQKLHDFPPRPTNPEIPAGRAPPTTLTCAEGSSESAWARRLSPPRAAVPEGEASAPVSLGSPIISDSGGATRRASPGVGDRNAGPESQENLRARDSDAQQLALPAADRKGIWVTRSNLARFTQRSSPSSGSSSSFAVRAGVAACLLLSHHWGGHFSRYTTPGLLPLAPCRSLLANSS